MPNAQDIVHAARLYKSALELIEDRPDTAYLALVSVVESLASVALNDFEPDEAEKVKFQAPVEKRARIWPVRGAGEGACAGGLLGPKVAQAEICEILRRLLRGGKTQES